LTPLRCRRKRWPSSFFSMLFANTISVAARQLLWAGY
jgi:hypothetical protein